MSVKVLAPLGVTEITAHGLIQWDYGQQLEVTREGLPSLVEVHFACKGMSEAVVRSCSVSADGTLTAVVPDVCLEQTTPVYAWVVVVDEASSTTVLTVILPITERIRPATSPSEVPEEIGNRYTEAIAAINEQIGRLASGEVSVGSAHNASEAAHAATADKAIYDENGVRFSLDYARREPLAKGTFKVGSAKKAETDSEGNVIHTTYAKKGRIFSDISDGFEYDLLETARVEGGVYLVRVPDSWSGGVTLLLDTNSGAKFSYSAVFYEMWGIEDRLCRLQAEKITTASGTSYRISKWRFFEGSWIQVYTEADFEGRNGANILHCRLLHKYPVG